MSNLPTLAKSKHSVTDMDVLACRRCNRLVKHLDKQKRHYPDYHNAPVPARGDGSARLLIVGLAPGLHGANASGIPFTGDSSGQMLFSQLARHGFLSGQPDDGQVVGPSGCRITNAVKCLPPDNLPNSREINNCNHFLRQEISQIPAGGAILALGSIAHKAVLKALRLTLSQYPFGHQLEHALPEHRVLLDSYHCSRYNFNTGRLDERQFAAVFERLTQLLE